LLQKKGDLREKSDLECPKSFNRKTTKKPKKDSPAILNQKRRDMRSVRLYVDKET